MGKVSENREESGTRNDKGIYASKAIKNLVEDSILFWPEDIDERL